MRTQIDLEPEQHAGAKRKAAEMGVSMAEYVRRVIERDLASPEPRGDISDIFALGRSGGSDIAAEGKSVVADAVEEDWIQRTR